MAATKIAYIQARWHTDITDNCKTAFVDEMQVQGYREHDIDFFSVPGSLEIPLMAKRLAKTGRYLAVCCSGLVVDGGIYRPRVRRAGGAPRHRQRVGWRRACRCSPRC